MTALERLVQIGTVAFVATFVPDDLRTDAMKKRWCIERADRGLGREGAPSFGDTLEEAAEAFLGAMVASARKRAEDAEEVAVKAKMNFEAIASLCKLDAQEKVPR